MTGFICGAWDLLHAGHIMALKEAKENCDYLVAGLHVDPSVERPTTKNTPIQSVYERWVQLAAVAYVDEIIPYETEGDLTNILSSGYIELRFLGEEYKNNQTITAHDACPIHFLRRRHQYSSTELRDRINARWMTGKR
jgi:glycerol-3-phosphate cytidylyltransferase